VTRFIAPGATLGVMGGGQLARMFVHAAQRMGYFTAVLDPDPYSPAGRVSHHHICADYGDEAGLAQLAQVSAAITTEFENVPALSLEWLGRHKPVAPAFDAVSICQHRGREKAFFEQCGVPCAPHALIESAAQLGAVDADLLPGILKTAQLGYDGKGQTSVATRAELADAFAVRGGVACVLEKKLALEHEISVIVARSADGSVSSLPVQQNLHRNSILAVTRAPAPDVSEATQRRAVEAALALVEAMRYVGVLCVEFFVVEGGALVANEMAPRPHNSGHHSIESCTVSQFEMQVRAMCNAPLPAVDLPGAAIMVNLLGDLWASGEPDWPSVLALAGVHLHLYGKLEARAGRKMGHLTVIATDPESARATARIAAAKLGLDGP
jgi:5-(carboxyamino)imidazole ribonucleotide synthase